MGTSSRSSSRSQSGRRPKKNTTIFSLIMWFSPLPHLHQTHTQCLETGVALAIGFLVVSFSFALSI
ncbi:unnamed protein product [Amoebophrya sp. A120]|nr:unnamed protein product [Amoebophrya sp. A120]|eukprot:GSA120T00004622001.1